MNRMAAALALLLSIPGPALLAQDGSAAFPFGTTVVVAPVQSVEPEPGGQWPGQAKTAEEAVRAMDAELEFALAARRGAENWALPSTLRRAVARNPMLDVDPDRLAFQGLLKQPDARDQLHEPLHGQLRALAALFGTRYVLLPLRLRVDREAPAEPAGEALCRDGAGRGRAELLIALIDIRRSAVMWHGSVSGAAVCPEAGGSLASLAARIAREVATS